MREGKYIGFLIIILIGFFFSCGQKNPTDKYSYFVSLPQQGWSATEPINYKILFRGEQISYRTRLSIRFNNKLEHMRANAVVRLYGRGRVFRADTIPLVFAHTPGEWEAKGIATREQIVNFPAPIISPLAGIMSLEVRLISPDTLRGIIAVGVELDGSSKTRDGV